DLRGGERQALCIDVAGAKQANGTDLLLWSCHGGTNQSFSFNRGSGEIRSAMGSWCVDVSSSGAWAGNRVQLWECNGTGAQKFHYDRASGTLQYAAAPSLCVDASGGSLTL